MSDQVAPPNKVMAYKGFDKNFVCKDFQYEIGKEYQHDGPIKLCDSGFHACEYPLDVWRYYAPATSRFAEVTSSGAMERSDTDTKIVSARIKIEVEISLSTMIERAVKWIFDRANPEKGSSATGNRGAASATGNYGAASATGHYGAASATGHCGAASATGYYGAASATGHYGAASATGHCGAASATGINGRAKGADGCALFLVYRDDNSTITHVWAGIVGKQGIKPDTWYALDADGVPQEVGP